MPDSLRPQDSAAEKEISKFLDKFLYSDSSFSDCRRVVSKSEQLEGKDIGFSYKKSGMMIVDEKAQVHYVNQNLPTFAFELDFLDSKGISRLGWFYDQKKKTEYYLLIWITADKEKDFKLEDIRELDCILISRSRLIVYLECQGLSIEAAKAFSAQIRESGNKGKYIYKDHDDFYFYFTTHLQERPMNLVIRKEILESLAEVMMTVTPDEIRARNQKTLNVFS